MVETASIMFEVGVIATVGFLGATLAARVRVSVIIGYIVAGILIGHHIRLDFFGLTYGGVLQESASIQSISQMGLVLLLFFVGLEFSIAKLRKTKETEAILAVTNLVVSFGPWRISWFTRSPSSTTADWTRPTHRNFPTQ